MRRKVKFKYARKVARTPWSRAASEQIGLQKTFSVLGCRLGSFGLLVVPSTRRRLAPRYRLDQARIIAEAQVDLVRIQDAKVRLINSDIMETMSADPGHDATRNPQGAAANLEPQSYDASSETRFEAEFVMAPNYRRLAATRQAGTVRK
jgi:hypothetical protein